VLARRDAAAHAGEGQRPKICAGMVALAGGCVLALMAAMTALSVTRRSFFGAPIPGDFELIEIGRRGVRDPAPRSSRCCCGATASAGSTCTGTARPR
jgi:hypothetical protein